jgi:hypothetical protein
MINQTNMINELYDYSHKPDEFDLDVLPIAALKLQRHPKTRSLSLQKEQEAQFQSQPKNDEWYLYVSTRNNYSHTLEGPPATSFVKDTRTSQLALDYDFSKGLNKIYKTTDPLAIRRNIKIQIMEYREYIWLIEHDMMDTGLHGETAEGNQVKTDELLLKIQLLEEQPMYKENNL